MITPFELIVWALAAAVAIVILATAAGVAILLIHGAIATKHDQP